MLIIGAKGFAKEVLEICHQNNQLKDLAFYDDVNDDISGHLFSKFPILKNEDQVRIFFAKHGTNFTLGLGKPHLRKMIYDKFIALGGTFVSTISPRANIGSYDVEISEGCNILANATISNCIKIGKGAIIYYHSIVSHDAQLGDFVEVSPGATLLGGVSVGSYTNIGSRATVLPYLTVGSHVVIGAGAVVTKNLPDHCTAVGVPARIIKQR